MAPPTRYDTAGARRGTGHRQVVQRREGFRASSSRTADLISSSTTPRFWQPATAAWRRANGSSTRSPRAPSHRRKRHLSLMTSLRRAPKALLPAHPDIGRRPHDRVVHQCNQPDTPWESVPPECQGLMNLKAMACRPHTTPGAGAQAERQAGAVGHTCRRSVMVVVAAGVIAGASARWGTALPAEGVIVAVLLSPVMCAGLTYAASGHVP